MIAVDTNVLVAAHRRDSPFHGSAATLLADLAAGASPWAIPWPCVHEFFSIVTHPRIFAPPSTRAQASAQIAGWLGSPSLVMLAETSGHWDVLKALIDTGDVAGPLVHDARIAALCLQHGVRSFVTMDRDFSRFPQLPVQPLAR